MTFWTGKKPTLIFAAVILLVLAVSFASFMPTVRAAQPARPIQSDDGETSPEAPSLTSSVYVPLLYWDYPWESPFAVESSWPLLESNNMLTRAIELPVGFVRMGTQISWHKLQPTEGSPIDWDLLVTFEDELRGLKAAGIRPVVVIKDSPDWALDYLKARDADGNLTSCGAIAADKFDEFAAFVSQLVTRYKTDEFNVHDWELGNEPDVDPRMLPQNHNFGCWGDADDPYYGGEHYGRMLIAVTPAIRQADSRAKVWIGGLLLNSPNSNQNNSMSELFTRGILEADPAAPSDMDLINGLPEQFFEGILRAGAAPYFDIVAYHWYATYWDFLGTGTAYDYDFMPSSPWYSWGGGTVGKARFLRQVMAAYGIDKPVVLNEMGFGCKEDPIYTYCDAPDVRFFESQANHLVRYFIRGLSERVSGFTWYTLNGPSWRNVGLLNGDTLPRSSYLAYQQLADILQFARYLYAPDYGPFIEAYSFRSGLHQVHVLWSKEDQVNPFYVPESKFIRAVNRDGQVMYDQNQPPPISIGTDYQLEVGFSPIYIVRYP